MSVEGSALNVGSSGGAGRAVFLSYAREDAEAARGIAEALRAFGVEVWFDQNELRGGDTWDASIRSQIKACALFIPIVSERTEERSEGYFRREWKLAVDRTQDMSGSKAFIVPVVIDDTPEAGASVPEEFMRYQWTRLAGGQPTPEFVAQVKRLLEAPKKPMLKSGPPKPPTMPPDLKAAAAAKAKAESDASAQAGKKSLPRWVWVAIVAALLGAIVATVMVLRKPTVPVSSLPPPASTPARSEPARGERVESAERASPATPRVVDKSIAVLPFANMSEDKDASAFFSDGIQEDILTNLAIIRELRVVSRTSVMAYRSTTKPMKQIAQELGVTYILEGSVRRAGSKVRVTGQLIHAATDEHVWAQSYDRDITDVFAIQAELSSQIAAALKTALSPEEKVLIARRPTSVPKAYDLYLQARDLGNRGNNSATVRKKQIEALEKAVLLDPAFAQAWGFLAARYAAGYFYNDPDMQEQLARAKPALDRAVALAPEDPEIIETQGTYYYYGFRDYERANAFYERLARLQPNSAVVFNSLALIQRRQGHWAESLANSRRACELDPANISYLRILRDTLGSGRRWEDLSVVQRRIVALLRDDEDAEIDLAEIPFLANGSTAELDALLASWSREKLETPENILRQWLWSGAKGDFTEAIRLAKLQPTFDGNGVPRWQQAAGQAYLYFAAGDQAGAIARLGDFPTQLRELLAKEPGNLIYLSSLADMEAMLGNKQEALRLAERYVALMPESRDALDGVNYAIRRAAVYDMVGERGKALAEYTRLLRVPAPQGLNVHRMKRDWSSLRGDPRFEALLNDPKNNAPLF